MAVFTHLLPLAIRTEQKAQELGFPETNRRYITGYSEGIFIHNVVREGVADPFDDEDEVAENRPDLILPRDHAVERVRGRGGWTCPDDCGWMERLSSVPPARLVRSTYPTASRRSSGE